MGFFARLMGVSAVKEELIRRLLRTRIAMDPSARAMGQGPEVADNMNTMMLMGMPEATIVTCVETWASLKSQGLGDLEIATRLAALRGGSSCNGDVVEVIRTRVAAEHGHSGFLPANHVERCIKESRSVFGI